MNLQSSPHLSRSELVIFGSPERGGGNRGGVLCGTRGLLCDAVRPLARSALGRLNRLAAFAAEDGYEGPDRMFFPTSRCDDLRKGHALRPLHHRDDLGLLVAALALLAALLGWRGLLRGLPLLG